MPELRDRSTLKRTARAREAEVAERESDMPAPKRTRMSGYSMPVGTTKTSMAKKILISKARQTAKDASKKRNDKAKALGSKTRSQQRLPSVQPQALPQDNKRKHESKEQVADESGSEAAMTTELESFEGRTRPSKRRALVDIRQETAVFPPSGQTDQPDSPTVASPSSQRENLARNNAALRQASRKRTTQKYKQAKKGVKEMPAVPEPQLYSMDSANPAQMSMSTPEKCEPRPADSQDPVGMQVNTEDAEGAEEGKGTEEADGLSTPTILRLDAGSASTFITLKVRSTTHSTGESELPAAASPPLEPVEKTTKKGKQPRTRKNKASSAEAEAAADERLGRALFREEDLNEGPTARAVFDQQLRERNMMCPSNKLAARRFKADLQKWAEQKGFPEAYDALRVDVAVKSSINRIGAFSKLTAASRPNLDQLED